MADKEIFVYVDLQAGPVLVGRLWSRFRKGRESASFEYDSGWLKHPERFALEPSLTLDGGPQHTAHDQKLFGALGDSAPDRWGRVLMGRSERRQAEREGRDPRTLGEIDYLLMVDDEARQGALRFAEPEGGLFLANSADPRIPLLIELPRLLSAGQRAAAETESDEELQLLLGPGSSLGGARPKALVRDADGQLAIAKFPHPNDEYDVERWEAVALTLASKAGIAVPEWRIETIADKAVMLLRRFDRSDGRRIHFLSAMSMLGARDNERRSYMEIVDAIRCHGAQPAEDCRALWRRIVFNVLISNTDDHLRNHGFLYAGVTGWRLSPAYDLNPMPVDLKARFLSTAIAPDQPEASLDLALKNAAYFDVNDRDARQMVREVADAVSTWRAEAAKQGLSSAVIGRMKTAFEHREFECAMNA